MTDTQRLFLAVWLPDLVVNHLREAVAPLRATAPDWLRWQPVERWHITLLFLGSCTPVQADETAVQAAAGAAEVVAGPLHLAGAGRTSSILWVEVEGAQWLLPLHRRLSRALLPHDRRERFRPHVTVARARGHRVARDPVDALRGYSGPSWTPPELSLVRSFTGPHPVYETIARFGFSR